MNSVVQEIDRSKLTKPYLELKVELLDGEDEAEPFGGDVLYETSFFDDQAPAHVEHWLPSVVHITRVAVKFSHYVDVRLAMLATVHGATGETFDECIYTGARHDIELHYDAGRNLYAVSYGEHSCVLHEDDALDRMRQWILETAEGELTTNWKGPNHE